MPGAEQARRAARTWRKQEARSLPIGRQPEFPDLWKSAAELLTSLLRRRLRLRRYGRELSTRAHPCRSRSNGSATTRRSASAPGCRRSASRRSAGSISRCCSTCWIETREDAWRKVARLGVAHIEQLVLVGNLALAQELLDAIVAAGADGGPFAAAARPALERLRERAADEARRAVHPPGARGRVAAISAFCRTLGPDGDRAARRGARREQGSRGQAAARHALQLRRGGPRLRRRAAELGESGRAPHGGRAAARVRRRRRAARSDGAARRRRAGGAARRAARHRADRHRRSLRGARTRRSRPSDRADARRDHAGARRVARRAGRAALRLHPRPHRLSRRARDDLPARPSRRSASSAATPTRSRPSRRCSTAANGGRRSAPRGCARRPRRRCAPAARRGAAGARRSRAGAARAACAAPQAALAAPGPATRRGGAADGSRQRLRFAEDTVRRLAAAVRGAQLYAPGHPLVRRSARRARRSRRAAARRSAVGRHRFHRSGDRRRRHAAAASRGELRRAAAPAAGARHRAHRLRARRRRRTNSSSWC